MICLGLLAIVLLKLPNVTKIAKNLLIYEENKASLPEKSEKYMKTIIAFANTQGGKLIVGVDDKTHQVVGVEDDVLFQLMDGIANAVSDSCVPQIIPDIEPQTVEGKTVIVVSVEAGKNRPYYLKAKGKENGTYIRVAGTSSDFGKRLGCQNGQ